jgi:pyruvyl transferase EpsO
MAFCIDLDVLKKHILTPEEKALFVKRNDVELNTRKEYRIKTSLSIEEKDWPTFDGVPVLNFMRLIFNKLAVSTGMPLFKNIYNAYMNLYRRISIKIGVRMVSSYKEVYTTRLHVAILRTLLDMSFCIYDNNYGKNKNFYNSWLHEYSKADLID